MTWTGMAALLLAAVGVGIVVFLVVWARVSRQLREMEPRETVIEHRRRVLGKK